MWFGTTDGLNKFDGHEFTVYQNIPGDSASLADNSVWALFEDSKTNLWVGTDGGGLSLFDRNTETFKHFRNDPENPQSLPHNSVNVIFEDSAGSIWIGTYGGGLSRMIQPGVFENYRFTEEDAQSISNDFIHHIHEDQTGKLWVGTRAGLNLLDQDTKKFIRIYSDPQDNRTLSNDNVLSITEDKQGILWLGTWGGGLNSYNPENGEIEHYIFNDASSNRVAFVHIDSNDKLWAGYLGKGLVTLERNTGELISFVNDKLVPKSLVNDNIWFLYEDDLKNLWVGTEAGISKLELAEKPIKSFGAPYFLQDFKSTVLTDFVESRDGAILFSTEEEVGSIERSVDGNVSLKKLIEVSGIWSMLMDDETIWVSSYGSGLFRYKKERSSYRLDRQYLETDGINLENATYLLKDNAGIVWLGTYGNGLAKYNQSKDIFEIVDLSGTETQDSPPILNLYDDEDDLWIGTYGEGLLKFNKRSAVFERFNTDTQPPLSNNTILSVLKDKDGIVWIGTDGGGLNRLDVESGQITIKTSEEGLPSNIVLSIIEDGNNNLWISSNEGISKYDKSTEMFENYDQSQGLISQSFNADAYLRDSKGLLYFGSGNGFNVFHPDSLRPSTFIPPVFFSDFKVLNKSVRLADGLLTKHINLEESITLSHTENFFSLSFVALDYTAPAKNKYAFRLEGLNDDWIYTDASNRQATFTNLDHGNYVLKVKASNSDGIWGENTKSMAIAVLPPPWKTWWAYSIYTVLFFLIGGLLVRTFIVRERLKANLKVERIERRKIEELDELKSKFFSGISHEFRTPLTLISAPINQLLKKHEHDSETSWSLKLVKRNGERLLRLINQLLDLSKLEAGKLRLKVSKSDVVSWIKVVSASFESLSESKDISFQMTLPSNSIMMFFDKEKLEQILLNLLSNAFKFSKSTVELKIEELDEILKIEVSNNGERIPAEDIENIFQRFFQSGTNRSSVEGTGIGLALVKELTELHHGTVEVDSTNERTLFIVKLPLSDAVYADDERVRVEETEVSRAARQQDEQDELSQELTLDHDDRPGLLIVEDNTDLRTYMAQQLASEYKILEASNGREGLDAAILEIPDLLITDVMMPEIDGIELLKSVRADHKTNHIPVIMLTAKADKETKLEGIEVGADHYLQKPFEIEELVVRVKSLLNQRTRIRNHYYNEFLSSPKTEDIISLDDQFLERAVAVIENYLDNHEFTVDQFAKELALSRVQLHRKLKAILGCSASEFIRHYRLKKAHEFLKNKKDTVSRIAYSVGFNNLSYFTKAFKEVYKLNPSDLLK